MLYLIDANVMITAHHYYYPIDRVPEYWEWLIFMGRQGQVKIPFEIFEEIKEGPSDAEKDLLYAWLHHEETKRALLLDDEVDPLKVQRVLNAGYAPDLTDDEVDEIGRDPFLIAHAMAQPNRCVVTVEASAPKKQRQNRRIPDVCKAFDQPCCNQFAFAKALGFRTQWKQDFGLDLL